MHLPSVFLDFCASPISLSGGRTFLRKGNWEEATKGEGRGWDGGGRERGRGGVGAKTGRHQTCNICLFSALRAAPVLRSLVRVNWN